MVLSVTTVAAPNSTYSTNTIANVTQIPLAPVTAFLVRMIS